MRPVLLLLGVALAAAWPPAQTLALEYQARYLCQTGEPDHLLVAAGLAGNRALVGGNRGLAILDLAQLPPQGSRSYLFRLPGVDARDVVLAPDEKHAFVNAHRGGETDRFPFVVMRIAGNTLAVAATVGEPGVLYEKMCLHGDLLLVAAHAHGLRIFDVKDRERPALLGSLKAGLTDAFAVAAEGTTAWVADGAGGLKVVDIANPAAPAVVAGETMAEARGTAEEVAVRNGRVYVAAGSAGLAVYEAGKLASRRLYPLSGAAESLCWVGEHLAVGHLAGVTLFAVGQGAEVAVVAADTSHRRGRGATLRLAEGVGAAGSRLLVANWNYVDVYEVKTAAAATQPDIEASEQRLRFPPAGGTRRVRVANAGRGPLQVTAVSSTSPDFNVSWAGGTLQFGQEAAFDIVYNGGPQGSGVVLLDSNDPDESPLPIQVFGTTTAPDPGEPAPDFTLPAMVRDPVTGLPVPGPSFTLSAERGKVVWLTVFASW